MPGLHGDLPGQPLHPFRKTPLLHRQIVARDPLHLVLVTAPDADAARTLAGATLDARFAACVNIVPQSESHYWWQGKREQSAEALMIIKTTKAQLNNLQKLVFKHHPYDTPEFVAFPASMVAKKYLSWVQDSVKPA